MALAEAETARRRLIEGAQRLELPLDERQMALIDRYAERLLAENRRINLTAMRTLSDVYVNLVLDSLTVAWAALLFAKPADRMTRVIDVGSGAGFPGIPLALVLPRWQVVLVEATGKKSRFLEQTAGDLQLGNVEVLHARAEAIGRYPEYRETAGIITARAVASIAALVELCGPLTAVGGVAVFPKTDSQENEISQARGAAGKLGFTHVATRRLPPQVGLPENRVLVAYQKIRSTPDAFPRRIGLAQSRPLG